MGTGAGWVAGARDGRGGAVRRPDAGTPDAGWDVDSGGGMWCEIMHGSCMRTRYPFGLPDASPNTHL